MTRRGRFGESPGRLYGLARALALALARALPLALALGLGGCATGGPPLPGDPGADQEGAAESRLATVFVGDSITQGLTGRPDAPPSPMSWVAYVVDRPGSPWDYQANAALAGDTLSAMSRRFQRDVLDRSPEAVVIMGGTNDVLNDRPLRASLAALGSMVRRARSAGARVWIVAPPPIPAVYGHSIRRLLRAERALAARSHVPFLDATAAVTDGRGRWRSGFTFDGLHPSKVGARALGEEVLRQVARQEERSP